MCYGPATMSTDAAATTQEPIVAAPVDLPRAVAAVLMAACGTTASGTPTPPAVGATSPARSSSTSGPARPATVGASTNAPVAATAAPIAAGPKAKTCRDLLSDSEVRQATGLANATLKAVDVTAPIVSETHCSFDAGTTTIEVSVWSADRLAAFDSVSSGLPNPITLLIPGATATFYDLSYTSTGVARTADHGVAVSQTPGDMPIPDMKAAAIAILRLVLGRI